MCADNLNLVAWMFKKDKPELFAAPEVVLEKASAFSSGEQILIKICLDIWSSEGGTGLTDVVRRLDNDSFKNVMLALIEWRKL